MKKAKERDFFIALIKKRDAERKSGVTSVYLPEKIDTGFLSRDHSGTVSVWCDKNEQIVDINETTLEELLWRHKFLDRRIVDVETQAASFVWKYKAWQGFFAGKPSRKMQVSVHRVLEHGFSSRVFKCTLTEGKCHSTNCSIGCRNLYWKA